MARINFTRQRGFTLIEALFSAIVLGIGLLALAGFQAVALQDGALVKMRMVATSLAQEKIDDLKSFTRLEDDPATAADECGAGIFCFSEIGNDAGGQEDVAGALLLPATTFTVSGTEYTRGWELVSEANGIKTVVVTISWTDNKGDSQEIKLDAAIYGLDPSKFARATVASAAGAGPKVSYTPVGVPDAVPVEVGDSQYKESSKPVPDVSQHGHSTLVSFDTTAYTTPGNAIESREEFVTLSCVCEFNGTGQGMTPTRMVWNSDGKILEPELGVWVNKTVGRKPTSGQAANQPALCDACCRDHHDVAGDSYPKYDPQRGEDVHQHYWPDAGGVLQAVTSGNYLEACRFKRINGLFYLIQDWHMRDMVVMPKDSYLEFPSTLIAYQDYLQAALEYFGLGEGTAPDKANLADRDFLELTQGQQAQLLARGIYVDTIYQCRPGAKTAFSGRICPSGNDPTVEDEDYLADVLAIKTANEANPELADNWRKHIPFYEINLTMLATWTSSQPSKISVANDPVQDIVDPVTGYYSTYYRGRVQGGSVAGAASIAATARRSNTGITSGVMSATGNVDGYGLDPHDDANTLSDSIIVTRKAATTTYGISGNLSLTFTQQSQKPKPASWGAAASPGSGVTCTSTGTGNNPGYSCTVPSGWSGTITPFATAGGSGNDPSGTTYYFSPTSRTYSNVTSAQTGQNFLFCKVESLCQ